MTSALIVGRLECFAVFWHFADQF